MKFSVIVAALNAGEKLNKTVDSVLRQTYADYEIVVKDGGSSDGSVEALLQDERIRLISEPDRGIYDAMNQAVKAARGEYILFLNCGDLLYDDRVLERVAGRIEKEKGDSPLVLYGDTYGARNGVRIAAPREIDGFACYRNIPCHQSCFYEARLCREKPYDPEYRIRADYDHFLWCFYRAGARMVYLGSTVSSYEGGGYSEDRENRARDKEEHRKITEQYMSEKELAGYRRTMLLTLAPLRSFLAENKLTSGIYHWVKECFYHHRWRILAGFVLFAAEMALYFGSGVMREEEESFLSGEDSYEVAQEDGANSFTQTFVPSHKNLASLSFLMSKQGMTKTDGTVRVLVSDGKREALFDGELGFDKIADGAFTDVDVNLQVSPGKTYYLTLITSPSSAGEYPALGVCGKEYHLPENGTLLHGEEMPDTQMVSRYCYRDVMPFGKAVKIIVLCAVTALGVMFGLPEDKRFRRAAGIVLLAAAPLVLGSRLEMLNYQELFYLPIAMKWNIGIMLALEISALLLTHSPAFAITAANVVLTLLYSANYFVCLYRGTPLRMNDFAAAGTAVQVMGTYSYVPDDHLAFVWGITLLVAVFGLQTGAGREERRQRKSARRKGWLWRKALSYAVSVTAAALLVGSGYAKFVYTDFLESVGFAGEELSGISYDLIYAFDGYLVGTFIDLKNSRILPPKGYTAAAAEEILAAAAGRETVPGDQEDLELPHIILVMNESFSDLSVLGGLELNMDNMPFWHSLEENTVKGYVNASVLGGGTANSEFEVFTGCSTAFFPANYYPYQQGISRPTESLVSRLEEYGYVTYSMHPNRAANWNRNKVYAYLGFDNCLWKEDFEGKKVIHHGVSDAETYQTVIELYESRAEGEKLFVWDLTMQNHGDYSGADAPYEVQSEKMQDAALDQYLTLIKISDEAFEDLVKYFEKQDEKVIICMFGDHQPWLSDKIVNGDGTDPNLDIEQRMNMYKTPFVIWANYDIEEADGYDISMNYLGGLLLRTAGVPLSPYFLYLEELREEYPIITVNGYVDSGGNYHNWSGDGSEFLEYRILQYNCLFDDRRVDWGF